MELVGWWDWLMKPSIRVERGSLSWVLRATFGVWDGKRKTEGLDSWFPLDPLPPLNCVAELAGLAKRCTAPRPARRSPRRPPSHAGYSGGW